MFSNLRYTGLLATLDSGALKISGVLTCSSTLLTSACSSGFASPTLDIAANIDNSMLDLDRIVNIDTSILNLCIIVNIDISMLNLDITANMTLILRLFDTEHTANIDIDNVKNP